VNDVAEETEEMDQPLIVLYAGDWDPSGLHMSQVDLPARLQQYGANVELRRIALSRADVADPRCPRSWPRPSARIRGGPGSQIGTARAVGSWTPCRQ
jgi:hypothetical protein